MRACRQMLLACTAAAILIGGRAQGSTILQVAQLPLNSAVHVDQAIILTTVNCNCCDVYKNFRVRDDGRAATVRGLVADINALLAGRESGDVSALDATTQLYGGVLVLAPISATDVSNPTISRSLAPLPVTLADFQDHGTTAEGFESNLVCLRGVRFVDAGATFAKGSYAVTDGVLSAQIQIARGDLDMVGRTVPQGIVDLTGIFDQTDFNAAVDQSGEGYHLQLLSYGGISPLPEPGAMAMVLGAALMVLRRRARCRH
jgi:hypothetical protein